MQDDFNFQFQNRLISKDELEKKVFSAVAI